jgi:hypothetical protein
VPKGIASQPRPLDTYGLPPFTVPNWDQFGTAQKQLLIEMKCFRIKWAIEKGGLPRYQHFKNGCKILWPWLEWNPWMEDQCEAFCNNSFTGVGGCASCVSGDTRILNPITGEQPTIEELTKNQIAPMVMTLDGPEQAEIPFVKGVEELFEVVLDNGTKFNATSAHRVLTSAGYVCVGSLSIGERLLGYAPILQGSNSVGVQSVHASGAQSSPKTVGDFRDDCPPEFHCGDARPLLEAGIARSSAPSLCDAPERSREYCNEGALASSTLCSLGESQFCHLSSLGFWSHHNLLGTPSGLRAYQGIYEHDVDSYRFASRFPQVIRFLDQALKLDRGLTRTQIFDAASELPPYPRTDQPLIPLRQSFARSLLGSCSREPFSELSRDLDNSCQVSGSCCELHSLGYRVVQRRVASIRKAGKYTFYDITVPKAAHYFAEGAIHHNSSKTTAATLYGVFWWLCGMECSAMVLTSTTKGNIRARAWNWVQKLYSSIQGPRIGNMVDSRTTWQGVKGDDRHCVCALAVREGSTSKAVGRIQGFHPDGRMLVIVDEATDTPEAIFDSFPNLIAGNWDFQVIVLYNPNSRFDPAGKFSEPVSGWSSVSVEDSEWETAPKLNGKPAKVLHFDAEKSPNITAGQVLYKHLPTAKMVEAARLKLGADSPLFFKFYRGFTPPEGIIQTVLTETMLEKHDAVGTNSKHIFIGGRVFYIAFLDPAFGGGDRAVLRIAKVSELEGGAMGIQLTKSVLINVSAQTKDESGKPIPIHFQISKQTIWHCKDNQVDSSHFGLDSTGEGGGLADIISREWSGDIQRVEFGGSPSDKRVSNEDDRLCVDFYDRKVTELHFTVKEFVVANQLKGMNSKEASDLCNRLWKMVGRKLSIEPKTRRKSTGDLEETSNWGFKERMGRSPDDGDALVGLCEVARRVGVGIKLQGRTARGGQDWMQFARKMDSVNTDSDEAEIAPEPQSLYALEDI